MANTDIQGKALPLLLSDDNWTTAYTVVCLSDSTFKLSSPVNTELTQCGVHTGIGPAQFSLSFNGIVNTTPAAVVTGAGEASYKKFLTWASAQTQIRFKLMNPGTGTPGTDFYQEGAAYLNDLSMITKVGEAVKFQATLTGTGVLDVTP